MGFHLPRRAHLLVGVAGVLVFVATGAYMRLSYHMDSIDPAHRVLLRSRHIYILFSSLLNLALAMRAHSVNHNWRLGLRRVGSCLVLIGPFMLVTAFFREATHSQLDGHLVAPAIFAALAGTLLHLASDLRSRAGDDIRAPN
jgi:hypothetical protein